MVYKSKLICYNCMCEMLKGGGNVGLPEKFGSLITKDKFESVLKNALKRQDITVTAKESDIIYTVSNGTASLRIDVSKAKRCYERNGSEKELEDLVRRTGLDLRAEERMVSFTNGQEFLRLMLIRESDIAPDMIIADFADGLKKAVVYTSDEETVHFLDGNILKRWDVPPEVVFSAADRNMCRILSRAEINEETICGNIRALDIKINSPVFCSSLILCNDFRTAVSERFGEKFFVVAPSRESLLVLKNITRGIIEGLGTVILSDYRKSKTPLTTDVLLFTPQEIRTAGHFSIGHSKSKGDNSNGKKQ